MGTPDFAAGVLAGLLEAPGLGVACVYTRPDRPAGRGKRLSPSPVKLLALERDLKLRQPQNFKNPKDVEDLAALEPDFLVVAAYGLLLPQAALDAARIAPLNVHTSLLPAYRGSAPAQRALMAGERETGVSLMRMEAGLDTGPVYAQARMATGRHNSGSLLSALGRLALPLLLSSLPRIAEGSLAARPQEGPSSYAAKLCKEEGLLDLFRPAEELDRLVRGLTPSPGAHLLFESAAGSSPLLLEEASPLPGEPGDEPGLALAAKGSLFLLCSPGRLKVERLRPQGKRSMDASAFLNGLRLGGRRAVAGKILSWPPQGGEGR